MEKTAADFNWLLEGWDERRYRKHLEQFLECDQCTGTLVLPYYSEYHPVSIHMQLAQLKSKGHHFALCSPSAVLTQRRCSFIDLINA